MDGNGRWCEAASIYNAREGVLCCPLTIFGCACRVVELENEQLRWKGVREDSKGDGENEGGNRSNGVYLTTRWRKTTRVELMPQA